MSAEAACFVVFFRRPIERLKTPAAARRFLTGVECVSLSLSLASRPPSLSAPSRMTRRPPSLRRYVSLVAFTAEVVVKVVACGERPSAFATDPEDGAFNLLDDPRPRAVGDEAEVPLSSGAFNLFDLAIVVVSIGFAATGGSGSTVAVGRLLRLVKVYYYYY